MSTPSDIGRERRLFCRTARITRMARERLLTQATGRRLPGGLLWRQWALAGWCWQAGRGVNRGERYYNHYPVA